MSTAATSRLRKAAQRRCWPAETDNRANVVARAAEHKMIKSTCAKFTNHTNALAKLTFTLLRF